MLNHFKKILNHNLTRSIGLVSMMVLLSRVLGFFRQFLMLERLDRIESDLLLSADRIPQFLSVFLVMGTAYSAILPNVTKLQKRSDGDFQTSEYLNLTFLFLGGLILFFSFFGVIFTPQLLDFFTSSEIVQQARDLGRYEEYVLTTRLLFSIPFVLALQTTLGAFLTVKKNFLFYSSAGIIANICSISALFFTNGSFFTVAIGMVMGWIITDFTFLLVASRHGYKLPSLSDFQNFTKVLSRHKERLSSTLQIFVSRILVIDGFYIAGFIINKLSTDNGQITAFELALAIQGAFFVIITSMSTVLFPSLSEVYQNSGLRVFWRSLFKHLKLSVWLGVMVYVLTFFGAPLVMYAYSLIGSGQGTNNYITILAQIASLGLVFRSLRIVLSNYLYVRERVYQPVLLSVIATMFTVLAAYLGNLWGYDPGIVTVVCLVIFNCVWVVVASFFVVRDYSLDTSQPAS